MSAYLLDSSVAVRIALKMTSANLTRISELLDVETNEEVEEFRIELMNVEDISWATSRNTVSLNREDLSDPLLATAG